jgi:hypothetical protein
VGGGVGAGSAWRRHAPTLGTSQPAGWPAAAKGLTSSPGFVRRPVESAGSARGGYVRGWGLSWAAGVGKADLAAGGQGAASLARLLGQQPTALSGIQKRLVDLAVVKGAGGDQVVEVAGRLPQLAVPVADRRGGDPGQLLGQGRPRIAVTRAVSDGWERDRPWWSLEVARLEPLEQHRGYLAGWGVEVAAGGPLVGVAGGVAAGWGDHIATLAAPIHMLKILGADVPQARRSKIEMPATAAGAHQRPRTLQVMGSDEFSDGVGAGGAVDVQDVEAVPGGQADVGLGVVGPPGQDPGPVAGGVLDPVGNQVAQGVLAWLAAARIPTRAAGPDHGV